MFFSYTESDVINFIKSIIFVYGLMCFLSGCCTINDECYGYTHFVGNVYSRYIETSDCYDYDAVTRSIVYSPCYTPYICAKNNESVTLCKILSDNKFISYQHANNLITKYTTTVDWRCIIGSSICDESINLFYTWIIGFVIVSIYSIVIYYNCTACSATRREQINNIPYYGSLNV